MELRNKTFLITGGGSSLGPGTARLFVESGANVRVAELNAETGQQVAAKLGDRARFVQTDVTSEESVQQAFDLALQVFGRLHGAVNCAGIPWECPPGPG